METNYVRKVVESTLTSPFAVGQERTRKDSRVSGRRKEVHGEILDQHESSRGPSPYHLVANLVKDLASSYPETTPMERIPTGKIASRVLFL